MKVPPPAPIQASRCRPRRPPAARANHKDRRWRRGSDAPFLHLRKEAAGDAFGKIRAFLLQEDQSRDARHRQQQRGHHRLDAAGRRWRRWPEMRHAQRDAEGQERHLRHRFGGGVGGDRGGGIAGIHAVQDHQPRRRHHAAHRRERRNLGDGIAHQPGEIEILGTAALGARQKENQAAPARRTPPAHRDRAAPGRQSRRARSRRTPRQSRWPRSARRPRPDPPAAR